MPVDREEAQRAIAAAIAEAERTKTRMCIAVVDDGANLKAFCRMDGAHLGCVDVAVKKAKAACLFGMPSDEIGKLSQPGGSLYGIERSNSGLITFAGGIPLFDRGGLLSGAIGVSGSTVDDDHQVARAGAWAVDVGEPPPHPWRS